MKRGFKSWCETTAIGYRKTLKLEKYSPLLPQRLADHLKIRLFTPNKIPGLSSEDIKTLTGKNNTWSAVTISQGNDSIIIYNSSHTKNRQNNDIMHELAHIIIGHNPLNNLISSETGLLMRDFEKEQEEEADWLAATLLLPKDALMKIQFGKISQDFASSQYGVSKKLLDMRLNTSGVRAIHTRARKKY